jgi:hypothetical protein
VTESPQAGSRCSGTEQPAAARQQLPCGGQGCCPGCWAQAAVEPAEVQQGCSRLGRALTACQCLGSASVAKFKFNLNLKQQAAGPWQLAPWPGPCSSCSQLRSSLSLSDRQSAGTAAAQCLAPPGAGAGAAAASSDQAGQGPGPRDLDHHYWMTYCHCDEQAA